jgi:putative transcriptional regulator
VKKKTAEMGVFDMVMAGLEDSIAYSRGYKKSLVTTRIPAPPPPMDARKVVQVRKRLNMSQGLFAAALNVSAKTVQGWEQGLRTPSNASLRLLQIAERQPQAVLAVVGEKPAAASVGAGQKPPTMLRRRGA